MDKKKAAKELIKTKKDLGNNQRMINFCEIYVSNGYNGKRAAISAGYSKKTAEVKASQLLSTIKVSRYVKALLEFEIDDENLKPKLIKKMVDTALNADISNYIENITEEGDLTFKSWNDIPENLKQHIKKIKSDPLTGKIEIELYDSSRMQQKLFELLGYSAPTVIETGETLSGFFKAVSESAKQKNK